jgi:large conductance mechanosensitive channel
MPDKSSMLEIFEKDIFEKCCVFDQALIVSFTVFLVIRSYSKMKVRLEKKKEEAPAAPPEPSIEEILLTEIRDLLKEKS